MDTFFLELKSQGDLKFLHYFYKIIKMAQGKLTENIELFNNLNSEKKKNYLVVPLIMDSYGLKSVLIVAYYDLKFQVQDMPRINLIGWYDHSKLADKLLDFEKLYNDSINVGWKIERSRIKNLFFFAFKETGKSARQK